MEAFGRLKTKRNAALSASGSMRDAEIPRGENRSSKENPKAQDANSDSSGNARKDGDGYTALTSGWI
jgi:hypothetical protein